MSDCPSANTLHAFVEGRLDPAQADDLHQHLDECTECQEVILLVAGPNSSAPPVHPGQTIFAPDDVIAGRYRVLHFLAKGGMGQVYQVHDLELGIDVALKTILPRFSEDERVLARFKREVLLARKVSHENVCRIFDFGLHRSDQSGPRIIHFLTMELLAGQTLGQRLREQGPLDPAQALPLVRQMAAALDAAHQQAIVHRDFKPDNVFLVPAGTDDERLVVTDFGLAMVSVVESVDGSALTADGSPIGTLAYMSPEQVSGKDVGTATDIYALGLVIYEMVTGQRPFVANTPLASALRRLTEPPPSPRSRRRDLDEKWEAVILRCLEREPTARYQRAGEVAQALEAPSSISSTPGSPQVVVAPSSARPGRGRIPALVLLGALLVLGVLLVRPFAPRGDRDKQAEQPGLARIPGGTFQMGSSPMQIQAALSFCQHLAGDVCNPEYLEREQPAHWVRVSSFYMDTTEVTNEDFAAWLNREPRARLWYDRQVWWESKLLLLDLYPSIGYNGLVYAAGRFAAKAGFEHKPVTQVTWDAARIYCDAHGLRLPTEAEWEYAAHGADSTTFPWGEEIPRCEGVVFGRGKDLGCQHLGYGPSDVGTAAQDRSPQGIRDLGGNVSEWVLDRFYERYPPCTGDCVDPQAPGSDSGGDPAAHDLRVARGGDWYTPMAMCRAAARSRFARNDVKGNVGFRCAANLTAAGLHGR